MEVIRGKVRIPKDYFNRAAKREYVFWARALIREFLQNSVDAGASTIRFKFLRDRLSLVVQDDGCGMDKETILNKLLALGGSQKQQGAVGGFGKAKEILFFAWSSYAIHTKCWLVEGEGSEYSIKKVGKYYNGTRCVIRFYNEQEFNRAVSSAIEYLPRSEIDADLFLDSSKISYAFGEKQKLHEFDWGTLYTCKAVSNDISIRVGGLEMFKYYINKQLKSQILIDLKGCSTDILVASRDNLNYKYSAELAKFINILSANPLSGTTSFGNDIQEEIAGDRVLIPESLLTIWADAGIKVPPENGNQGVGINKSKFTFPNFKYEFLIRRSTEFSEERINGFMEDPVAEPLAQIWTSLIFEIIIANKIPIRLVKPGFIFNRMIRGLCAGKPEVPSILLNPLSLSVTSAADHEELMQILEDIAYHEIAHIKNRKHDELFVSKMGQYREVHRKWKKKGFSTKIFNWRNISKLGGENGRIISSIN